MKLPLIPQDKANHFIYGLIIFFITALIFNIMIALITATLFAVGKEIYDCKNKERHTPDKWDAIATIGGGVIGILIVLLLGGCSPTWHYNRAIKKGMQIYAPKSETKTKEIIPEKITLWKDSISYDTIVYREIERIEKRDTVYSYKTKIDYRIDKNRLKFMEDSIKLSNIRFKDSLRLSIKKDIKNNRSVVRSKKKGIFQRFKDYLLLVLFIVAILVYILLQIRKKLPL